MASSRPLQAAILLSSLYLLSRIIGLVQGQIINANLSATAASAYTAAFDLPDYINYLIAGGALSVTFIPLFTQLRDAKGEAAAWKFFSTITTLMGSVLLVLVTLSVLLARPLMIVTHYGLAAPEKAGMLDLAVRMTKIMLPAQLFFYGGGLLVGVLNAHKRFGASGWTGAVYNGVAIIVGFIVWFVTDDTGFAWGILVGAFAGNFLLPLCASLNAPPAERLQFKPNFDWRDPTVKRFFANALPIMLGVSFPILDQKIANFWASGLSDAALRDLNLGNRLMLAPLSIVAQAASVAAFPFLASESVAQDWPRFSEFLRTGLRRLMFLTLPLSTLLILTARPILGLLRFGNFQNAGAEQTAACFAFFCVGLFAWAGQQLVARGFYALQDTLTPTVIGSALLIVFFPLCWPMAHFFGVPGLALATSLGAVAYFRFLLLALEKKMQGRRYRAPLGLNRISGTLIRTTVACIVMGAVGLIVDGVTSSLFSGGKGGDLGRIIVISLAAGAAFIGASHAFKIPEWTWLRGRLLGRFARRFA